MESEHLGDFGGQVGLNVGLVLGSIELNWVGGLESSSHSELHLLHDGRDDKFLQVSHVGTPVHFIGDVTAVHNLSVEVLEISVWHLFVLG